MLRKATLNGDDAAVQARGHRRGSWLALAAAYLLFVQALLTGAAMGAQAAPAIDFHGHVLCAPSLIEDGGGPADHGKGPPACCTLGCATVGVALPPPLAAGLLVPRFAETAAPTVPKPAPLVRAPERTPRLSRGPPSLA